MPSKRKREEPPAQEEPEKDLDVDEDEDLDEDEDSDNEDLVMDVDEHGRISGTSDCGLSFEFTSNKVDVSSPSTKASVKALAGDAKRIFDGASSFWLPAGVKPRFGLEALASQIFEHHTKDVKDFDRDKSGAEWWIQVRHGSGLEPSASSARAAAQVETQAAKTGQGGSLPGPEDVGFHWDKDENLVDELGLVVCPSVSTVTYLTDGGAPTIILDIAPHLEYGKLPKNKAIPKAHMSFPECGKHIKFDGRLLHAAPSDVFYACAPGLPGKRGGSRSCKREFRPQYTRVSFLVNVWLNWTPRDTEYFPQDSLHLFEADVPAAASMKFDAENAVAPVKMGVKKGTPVQQFKHAFGSTGREHSLTLKIPVEDVKGAAAPAKAGEHSRGSFTINFDEAQQRPTIQ